MKPYPSWVMTIALGMICAGILPMPLVYLLRRFQVLKVDLDIHQGSIRRNETTASTKEMIDQDDDVSINCDDEKLISIKVMMRVYRTFHCDECHNKTHEVFQLEGFVSDLFLSLMSNTRCDVI